VVNDQESSATFVTRSNSDGFNHDFASSYVRLGVKSGNREGEQSESALPPEADIARL
jgi:hypothetical protein